MNPTHFPMHGENKEVALKNSNYEQFDYEFALDVQKNHKDIWNAGGKRKANNAFALWDRARNNEKSTDVEKFLKARESYIDKNKTKENLSSIVALMKWGGIADKGINYMKDLVRTEINKMKKATTNTTTLSRRETIEKSIKDAIAKNHQMPIVYKTFHVDVKKYDDGTYRFIASKEVRDADDEVVAIDGIDFTRYAKNPIWLWGHRMMNGDIYDVIGKCINWQIELDSNGLKMLTFEPVYAPHQKAQDLKAMHMQGMAVAISIGFRIKEYDFDSAVITSCELYETSNVIVPSNPDAIQYAQSKGLLTHDEQKAIIKDVKFTEYKSVVKEFRRNFLSKELCELLGYEKTGVELDDITNIYAILKQAIVKGRDVENQQNNTVTQKNSEPVLTSIDAKEIVKSLFS